MSDLESSIQTLLKQHPRGFAVNHEGALTPNEEAEEIKSLDDFSKIVRAPKTLQLPLPGGKLISIKIRPLNSVEASEIDKLDDDEPQPPKKTVKPAERGKPAVEEFDFENRTYQRERTEWYHLKRAAIIAKALVGIEVPGENLEAKRAYLAENFTPQILEGLQSAIFSMTKTPIETATFI